MRIRRDEETPSSAQQTDKTPLQELQIIQYNCGNANYRMAKSLFDSLDPSRHHLIAVQEPFFNRAARTTYCPLGYTLCYLPKEGTRVCFLVSKRIRTQDWLAQLDGEDIITLSIRTDIGWVDIINIYQPTPTTPQSVTPSRLPEIATVLEKVPKETEISYFLGTSTYTTQPGEVYRVERTLLQRSYYPSQLYQASSSCSPKGRPPGREGAQQRLLTLSSALQRSETVSLHAQHSQNGPLFRITFQLARPST